MARVVDVVVVVVVVVAVVAVAVVVVGQVNSQIKALGSLLSCHFWPL